MTAPRRDRARHLAPWLFGDAARVSAGDVELRPDDDPQRLREKLARVVLDETSHFVGLLDPAGRILEINLPALRGAGLTVEGARGAPFWETRWWSVSGDTQRQCRGAVERAARGEVVRFDVEIYGAASGEETVVVGCSLAPVRDPAGVVRFLLAELRIISDKKRADAELARKNRELADLLQRVQQLDELKSQLFANVSHELRTPLTLILGPTERLLGEGGLEPRQRRDLEVVQRNATTLLKHVNDLLDVAQLEAARVELAYAEVDLAALVRRCASHFEPLAEERAFRFVVEARGPLPAQVDPDRLERVLLNLIANAFKFTPAGGRVKIEVTAVAGGRALITVQDSGPGVPPEDRERVFERFRQAKSGEVGRRGGSGLGLAIARDFVRLHRGAIAVDEAPGGGALFWTEVPLKAPAGVAVRGEKGSTHPNLVEIRRGLLQELRGREGEEAAPAEAAPQPPPRPGRPRVLVIEDNPDMNRFVVETLETDFEVSSARDGSEGLTRALASRPDLLVTDMMMPGLSGEELLSAVSVRPELAGTPVLVLSAKVEQSLRIRLLQQGAQDFLVKPFAGAELRARAHNLVRVKRATDLLRAELDGRQVEVDQLAAEMVARKREAQEGFEAMRQARDDAERLSEAKSSFLSLVSHELRTPLQSALLQVDLLQRLLKDVPPQVHQRLERFSAAADRLDQLVSGLLEYARLDSGRLDPRPEASDVPVVLRAIAEELRPRARSKRLALRLELPASLPLLTDPHLLRHVVQNLLENAIKYTGAGEVVLRCEAAGEEAVIEVQDTGPGISADEQERIFLPFEQLAAGRRKHIPGVGLGLALVRRLADALGATLALRSAPGAGSTFRVRVPPLTALQAQP